MDRPIDRDYARMMTELRTARQDWHTTVQSPKRSLLHRLTHRPSGPLAGLPLLANRLEP